MNYSSCVLDMIGIAEDADPPTPQGRVAKRALIAALRRALVSAEILDYGPE